MSYQVIARKFRPDQFEQVIGQEQATDTLKNAIQANRVAHAYLFSGPRGVGKTTTARLLAKALNCEKGLSANPCGDCVSCREIAEGSSLDVLEVDGASNNGVDQVRSITDTVKYNAKQGKYKIYIIDEVHMLSTAAFNALLKTLEEPPPRVLFVFATTELHKIPETILSRCQHFVFRLVPEPVLLLRLQELLRKEKVSADAGSLALITKASGGSVRDAETLLEKIITFCGNPIREELALRALGIVAQDLFYELSDAIFKEHPSAAFSIIQKITEEGRNLGKFVQDAICFFRSLLFLHLSPSLECMLSVVPKEIPRMKDLAKYFQEPQLLYILEQLSRLEMDLKTSLSPRILAEITLVKLCHSKHALPIEQVLKKINHLEDRLKKQIASHPPAPSHAHTLLLTDPHSPEKDSPKSILPTQETLLSLEKLQSRWADFLHSLDQKKLLLKAHIQEASLVRFQNNELILLYPESMVFHARIVNEPENHNALCANLTHFFNHHLTFKIEIDTPEPPTPLDPNPSAVAEDIQKVRALVKSNPLVSQALEVLEGKVIRYQRKKQEN
jgi:DNA polymerase-3 subunit gamma/tau